MNIVLCGMMGCGKTVVSAELVRLTGLERVDTDEEIVKKYGRIADIFSKYGEERFREIEREVVAQISSRSGIIIATGGGCVLSEENVRNLKRGGKIFFLQAEVSTLIKCLEGDTERPLLAGDSAQRIAQLLAVRTPIYTAAADEVVVTDGNSPAYIAKLIASKCGLGVRG